MSGKFFLWNTCKYRVTSDHVREEILKTWSKIKLCHYGELEFFSTSGMKIFEEFVKFFTDWIIKLLCLDYYSWKVGSVFEKTF